MFPQDLVAIYWAEANYTNHPAFLSRGAAASTPGGGGPVRWGLSDLTVYATAYYYNVIVDGQPTCNNAAAPWGCESTATFLLLFSACPPTHISPAPRHTDRAACSLSLPPPPPSVSAFNRMLISACNPMACPMPVVTRPGVRVHNAEGEDSGQRLLRVGLGPFLYGQPVPAERQLQLLAVGNTGGGYADWYKLADGRLRHPGNPAHCLVGGLRRGLRRGGTSYGEMSRNVLRNDGNGLQMDQWKQVVVEDNVVTGASLAATGNNIATYNGGYAQHVALLNNSISHVWGGDREVMTYDNAGGMPAWTFMGVAFVRAALCRPQHVVWCTLLSAYVCRMATWYNPLPRPVHVS